MPPTDWLRQSLPVEDLVAARYNSCCALALASGPAGGRVAECQQLLAQLLASGDAELREVTEDDDFAHLRTSEWWPRLLETRGGAVT